MTANQILSKTLVNKIFVCSEFHPIKEAKEGIYDANGDFVVTEIFTPFGKKIERIEMGQNDSREDVGLLITFEGWDCPFFFYDNDDLEVVDCF